WSPDGSKICFEGEKFNDGDKRHIYIMNSDGTGCEQFTFNITNASEGAPGWLPDGNTIAFWRNGSIYLKSIGGGETKIK
ncbi:MAG TPA: translocation protein TolB, partial [Bacillota bacterium]|nr:translocation protein TolB [Bacillota bacterium]